MKIGILIFIVFLLLNSPLYSKNQLVSLTRWQLSNIKKDSFHNRENMEVYEAMILGDKRGIPRVLLESFKSLGIMHLLTPSGMHFSILYRFFKLHYAKTLVSSLVVIYTLFISYSFLPGFYAFKRFALYQGITNLNKLFTRELPLLAFNKIHCLLITLIIDIFFGTFQINKMSFTLSFLFLFILSNNDNKWATTWNIYKAQIAIAYIFGNSLSIIAPILGLLLTTLYSIIFPLLLINLPFIHLFNFSELLIELYCKFIQGFSHLSMLFYFIKPNLLLVLGVLIVNRNNFLLIGSICAIMTQY